MIDGGAGNDDMGSGDFSGVLATNDVFVFLPGYERDLIRGFTGNDKVLLQGFGITSFAQLQQYMTVSVNVTAGIHIFTATIMLNGSDVLTITGRGDGPSAAHFIFDVPPAPVTADNTIQRLTGGEDTIQISSNQNTIYGAEGNDTFTGTTNRSTLEGGAGGDSFNLDLSSNNALLGGDDGSGDSLFVTGGMGNYLMGAGGNDWLGVGQSGATASTNNTLGGGDGDDLLNATGTGNTLIGGAGQDQFAAVGNQNRLFGEDGNDSLQANGDSNSLDGGDGNDLLFLSGGQHNTLIGGAGNDWLGTNGGTHTLYGGAGDDWMGATGTNCGLFGESGNDTVFGVGLARRLRGGDGNDWVGVSGNSNNLNGEAGDDFVAATGNSNIFNGGSGNDQMVAAAGHSGNTYIFQPGSGQDSITGFEGEGINPGGDFIDLRGFGIANFAALDPFMSSGRRRHSHCTQRRRHPDAQEHQRGHAGGQRFLARLSESPAISWPRAGVLKHGRRIASICSLCRMPAGVVASRRHC